MALSAKQQEDADRLRYIRVTERFIRSVVGYLVKEDDVTFEGFCARVYKQKAFMDKAKKVPLYKAEYTQMLVFVTQLLSATKDEPEDFEKLRGDLLHTSNQLHKSRNNTKYKKDKHSKHKYNDGY